MALIFSVGPILLKLNNPNSPSPPAARRRGRGMRRFVLSILVQESFPYSYNRFSTDAEFLA
jgi:hypothetical protein